MDDPQFEQLSHCGIQRLTSLTFLMCLLLLPPAAWTEEKAFTAEADDPEIEWGSCPDFMPTDCSLAILQGDPQGSQTDVLFRLAGKSTAPLHWHTSAERMVLIQGELHVDYKGQDPVVMHPGTYAYGPPALPHVAECRSSDPCVLFIAFAAPVDAFAGSPTE